MGYLRLETKLGPYILDPLDHLGLGQKSGTNLGEPHEILVAISRFHHPSPDDPCGSTRSLDGHGTKLWKDVSQKKNS
jgi:hypothetical protein